MANLIYGAKDKDLVIISHREVGWLSNKISSLILNKLKDKFIFAIHYGYYRKKIIKPPSWCDFVLGSPSTLRLEDESLRLNLCSRDFVINESLEDLKAVWDTVCIANPHPSKKIDQYLNYIKKSNNKDLLILQINDQKYTNHTNYLRSVYQRATALSTLKKNFSFFPIYRAKNLYGIDQITLFKLISLSKILVHTSDVEGESRIISEALSLGKPVVAYKRLLGGGLDHLNESNSMLYDNYEDLDETINKALEKKFQFYYSNYQENVNTFISYVKNKFDFSPLNHDVFKIYSYVLPCQKSTTESVEIGIPLNIDSFNKLIKFHKNLTQNFKK